MLASLPPVDRARFRGDGPCDFYDRAGRARPNNVAYLQRVVDGYERQLAAACARVARCRTDGGAMSRAPITRRDLASDLGHPSVFGHSRKAAAVWPALGL